MEEAAPPSPQRTSILIEAPTKPRSWIKILSDTYRTVGVLSSWLAWLISQRYQGLLLNIFPPCPPPHNFAYAV